MSFIRHNGYPPSAPAPQTYTHTYNNVRSSINLNGKCLSCRIALKLSRTTEACSYATEHVFWVFSNIMHLYTCVFATRCTETDSRQMDYSEWVVWALLIALIFLSSVFFFFILPGNLNWEDIFVILSVRLCERFYLFGSKDSKTTRTWAMKSGIFSPF